MSGNINIQGTTAVDDPAYRYKMPPIQGKVEGRGNGIKTAIPNMTQVAMSLHREPGEVTKFFGCELGAQTTWSPDTERAIVNGAHTTSDLQTKLFVYIESFVLCPECRLPETIYSIKNEVIHAKCAACGAKSMMPMGHKLCTYILSQNKKNKKSKKDKESKKDRKERKEKGGAEDTEEKEEKKEKKKKDKKEKKDKDKKKKKKKEKKEKDGEEEEDEDGSASDEEAGGAAAEADGAAAEAEDEGEEEDEAASDEAEDEEEDEEEELSSTEVVTNSFRKFLEEESPDGAAMVEHVRANQQKLIMPLSACAYIMVQVLFDENIIKGGQLAKHMQALTILVASDANKFMARHLIGAFEEFFCKHHPSIIKVFPLVLKTLYDEDVLEEEVILDWAVAGVTHQFSPTSVSAPEINALRASCDTFITWLKEADEEEDDE